MQISFVRTVGEPDRVYVRRSDGSETSWSFPTYGDELPHDLVHLVVEAVFEIQGGFWDRVDAGVDVSRINREANRAGGRDKYAGFGPDRDALLVAEALAGLGWGYLDMSDAERRDAALAACARVGGDLPETASLERFAEVRAQIDALRSRWRALSPKGTLRFERGPRG
jgi:hypothetical protein